MSRQERMHRKVYRAQRNGWRWAAMAMTAVSLLLVTAGLWNAWRDEDQLAVEPAPTPAPTPVTRVFDETATVRELLVPATPWYAIQLGVFEAEESAVKLAETYRARGAAGYIWPDGDRYRVLAAVYPDEEDARRVRDQLKLGQSVDSYVFVIRPAELTLKLSGMTGQLDVLEAVYAFWKEAALGLQTWSVELDQRETDGERLRQQLNGVLDVNRQLVELISQRFTQPYHGAVQPAVDLMTEFDSRLKQRLNEISSVELGAGLKYETLWLIEAIQRYYEQL